MTIKVTLLKQSRLKMYSDASDVFPVFIYPTGIGSGSVEEGNFYVYNKTGLTYCRRNGVDIETSYQWNTPTLTCSLETV